MNAETVYKHVAMNNEKIIINNIQYDVVKKILMQSNCIMLCMALDNNQALNIDHVLIPEASSDFNWIIRDTIIHLHTAFVDLHKYHPQILYTAISVASILGDRDLVIKLLGRFNHLAIEFAYADVYIESSEIFRQYSKHVMQKMKDTIRYKKGVFVDARIAIENGYVDFKQKAYSKHKVKLFVPTATHINIAKYDVISQIYTPIWFTEAQVKKILIILNTHNISCNYEARLTPETMLMLFSPIAHTKWGAIMKK